jgi:hypothetical protein
MSHLVTVYSPAGEPFEVTPDRVGDLVLLHGWSQTKPDPNAEPAVTTVDGAGDRGWRSSDELPDEEEYEELEEAEAEDEELEEDDGEEE